MKRAITLPLWGWIVAGLSAVAALALGFWLIIWLVTAGNSGSSSVQVSEQSHRSNLDIATNYYDENCPDNDNITCLKQPEIMNTAVQGIVEQRKNTPTWPQLEGSVSGFDQWYAMWEQNKCDNWDERTAYCDTIGKTATTAAETINKQLTNIGE